MFFFYTYSLIENFDGIGSPQNNQELELCLRFVGKPSRNPEI